MIQIAAKIFVISSIFFNCVASGKVMHFPNQKNRTICFQTHDVSERGVDVAIFDYADYNEKLLGYKSLILIPDNTFCRNGASLPKLTKRFGSGVIFYKPDMVQLPRGTKPLAGESFPSEAKKYGCDLIYIQKSGEKNSVPRFPEAFDNS
jgi:hypothetical protein